ncbi:hypothetical protein E3N88_16168 [Mikania micrantha]|uniref:50S ribosomal protein L22, chloroplastic n=1 Tax=Mikania micrantha TaxID=192012 RepID=A0A5N6NYZ1_9ASTR|nr:hypothetical protein E3N88_16168 [Mikania micrantha]
MSAHKARRVIDQIRGRSYEETLMILELMPYRACYPIFKLVYSAAANASSNMGSNEANLVISKAEVNKEEEEKCLVLLDNDIGVEDLGLDENGDNGVNLLLIGNGVPRELEELDDG